MYDPTEVWRKSILAVIITGKAVDWKMAVTNTFQVISDLFEKKTNGDSSAISSEAIGDETDRWQM